MVRQIFAARKKAIIKMRFLGSYTAWQMKIQPAMLSLPLVGALMIGGLVSGCGQVTMQVGTDDVATPTVLTGSILSPSDEAYSDITAQDRQVIAARLDALNDELATGSDLMPLSVQWQNEASGNAGTLWKIDTDTFAQTGCLTFKTTANTIAGVKLYSGTACRDISERFTVTALTVTSA